MWKSYLEYDNTLKVDRPKISEVEFIFCSSCGKEYGASDFAEIDFSQT